jgi:tetratricopeptide (TPR) repeat protein
MTAFIWPWLRPVWALMLCLEILGCAAGKESSPADGEPYLSLGNIYLREGNLDRAAALFRQALAADSAYALAYNSLGHAHLLRREYGEALRAYGRALELDSGRAEFRENLENASRLAMGEGMPVARPLRADH